MRWRRWLRSPIVADHLLAGCRVVVTREQPGELGRLLVHHGAELIHVPLIEVVDPIDEGAEFEAALQTLHDVDWLIVTSPAGAERAGAAAASNTHLQLAAVGTATAERLATLAGRPIDLVPDRQLAESLAEQFVTEHVDSPQRIVLALADRAATLLADVLTAAGHSVLSVVAYRTVLRHPSADELASVSKADAVLFTSGSTAEGWAAAMGARAAATLPRLVVAIGPTTATKAHEFGLKVSSVAADHSLVGLVKELATVWRQPGQS